MGPSKRSKRSLPEESDEESEDYESQQGSSRKRRRSDQGFVEDDLNDIPDDEDDDDELYLQASQAFMMEQERPRQNVAAPYGTILAVTVENFMCHKLLEVQLGSFMNFIVGQNGSGKSAILTAITLCLGGKASTTNRAANIKGFIKTGEHSAMIEVKIRNGGDGYKTELYGDVIIVQRVFNRDGGGGYKLRSKLKKVISTKKEELEEICEFMGLQIDNPMTVLSQDLARQFLNDSTPKQKYTYFMKGVHLDQLHGDYSLLEKAHRNITDSLSTKNADIDDLKEAADAAEKKFNEVKETENLRSKVELYIRKFAWSQVYNAEADVGKCKKTITDKEDELESYKTREEELRTSYEQSQDEVQKAKDDAESALQAVTALKEQKDEYKAKEYDPNKQALISNQQDERDIHGSIKDAENKVKDIEKQIEAERRRLEGMGNDNAAKLLEDQNAANAEKESIQKDLDDLIANQDNQEAALRSSGDDSKQASDKYRAKDEEIRSAQRRIRDLENSKKEALSAFGNNIHNLLRAIDTSKWQSEKPIGPVGIFVKLREQKWSTILERQLGSTLSSFIVHTQQDKRLLQDLMKRTRCEWPISLLQDNKSIQLKEPPEENLTVLRALEISNDDALKALVINNFIEQTVLIEDYTAAMTFMARPPENIKFCYSMQPRRGGWGFNVKGGSGSGGLTPIRPADGAPKMSVNVDASVRQQREELDQLNRELSECDAKRKECASKERELKRAVDNFARQKLDYTRQLQKLDDHLDRIATNIEEAAQDGNLGNLSQQLELHKEKLEHYKTQYEEVIIQKDMLNDKGHEVNLKIKEFNNRLEEARAAASRCQEESHDIATKRERLLSQMNGLDKEQANIRTNIETAKIDLAQKEKNLTHCTGEAAKVGERIQLERGETTEKLEKYLTSLDKSLQDADARIGGSAEEIARAFTEKKERYLTAKKDMDGLRLLIRVIKETWEDRIRRWYHFRATISFKSRIQFSYYMSEREFNGKLVFKHDDDELLIAVQPTQQANDGRRETNTLSGGEKSYSQICLLLALWDAMGAPFRCLDEFDVFMDAVNRGMSMNLIVKVASRSYGKQFILITPQDVSTKAIEGRTDVKIVRMRDPERNQTRLNFGNS